MKNILFFGYYFYPDNEIGAVRISELVLRFAKNYNVYVILNKNNNPDKIENVHYIFVNDEEQKNIKNSNLEIVKKTKSNNKFVRYLKQNYHTFKNIINSYKYFKKFISKYKSELNIEFDLIISTYGPLANHLCALHLKKKNKKMKWIADFRDPMNISIIPYFFRGYMKCIQNEVCKYSDYIVCVSEGYLEKIVRKKYLNKAMVITNGYSKFTGIKTFEPNKFSFLYLGSMYEGKRSFEKLFEVLRKKIIDDNSFVNDLELNYIGNDNYYFEEQCRKFNLYNYYNYLGKMSRMECLVRESQSYFLLLSTWNDKNYKGVIPGKFFEYLSVNRKIISICNGKLDKSEVGNLVNDLNVGLAIENSTLIEDVYKYIEKEYKEFKNRKYNFDSNGVDKFNYANIANKYIEIINKLFENE